MEANFPNTAVRSKLTAWKSVASLRKVATLLLADHLVAVG